MTKLPPLCSPYPPLCSRSLTVGPIRLPLSINIRQWDPSWTRGVSLWAPPLPPSPRLPIGLLEMRSPGALLHPHFPPSAGRCGGAFMSCSKCLLLPLLSSLLKHKPEVVLKCVQCIALPFFNTLVKRRKASTTSIFPLIPQPPSSGNPTASMI